MTDTAATLASAALTYATTVRDQLVDEGADWTAERVDRAVALVRADLDEAIEAVRGEHGIDGHDATDALLQVAAYLLDLAAAVNADKPLVLEWTVRQDTSLALLAFELYQDVERREELDRLNRIPDPNRVRAGTVLKVYAS